MRAAAKVVPIGPRAHRVRTTDDKRSEPEPKPSTARVEGTLRALARLAGAGLTLENAAQLWSRLYFAWHSEEVDEFGYDPKFTARVLPFFEFLYTVWWRVEAAEGESPTRTAGCCGWTMPSVPSSAVPGVNSWARGSPRCWLSIRQRWPAPAPAGGWYGSPPEVALPLCE